MAEREEVTIDISARLRGLLDQHRLTVAEMAARAGVSKSAMEKYLAGPSSPRAVALAAICRELRVSADWLLFGITEPDEEQARAHLFQHVKEGFNTLLIELKLGGPLSNEFNALEPGSMDFRQFAHMLSQRRAFEVVEGYQKARQAGDQLAFGIMSLPIPLPHEPSEDR